MVQDASMPASGTLNVLNLTDRRPTDLVFGFVYLILFIATGGIAIYASTNSPTALSNLGTCANASASELDPTAPSGNSSGLPADVIGSMSYMPIPLFAALLLGIVWMTALRFFAKPVVYLTLIIKGVILMGVGMYLYTVGKSSCGLTEGDCTASFTPLILCALGLLYFVFLFCLRRRIALTAHLIEQSVNVVVAHPGLFLASAGLFVVKIAVLALCLVAYLFLLGSELTPNQTGGCDITVSTADKVMYGVITVFLYWSVQLWLFMRFYVVSLTTGVWYYTNESLASQEGGVHDKALTQAPVCMSLRLAFTKSFGTIAFASLLIAICESLKRLAQKERRNGGLVGCLIACCITCILSYLEFLTRFALTFHALTGDDFCTSGKNFLHHASRHGFTAIMVDYLAALTLQFGAIVLGLLVTALTVFIVDEGGHVHDSDRTWVLVTAGLVSWFIASVVLVFIGGILLNVVDACYACLVLDLDHASHTGAYQKPIIAHAVIATVNPTYIIQQPGGSAAIAQPVQPYPQTMYEPYPPQPQYVAATIAQPGDAGVVAVTIAEPIRAAPPARQLYPDVV